VRVDDSQSEADGGMIGGIIGGVVGLLLIGVIVVVVLFLVRRRRKSNANHEDKQSVEIPTMVSATPTIYSSITPASAASSNRNSVESTSKGKLSSQQLLNSSNTAFFSVIPYTELKFIELVGKGAFGEVWKGMSVR
jgi:predicted metalloprotease